MLGAANCSLSARWSGDYCSRRSRGARTARDTHIADSAIHEFARYAVSARFRIRFRRFLKHFETRQLVGCLLLSARMTTDLTTYVFGVHHFCDHRCWRCPLAPRCAVHARWAESGRLSAWREPAGRVAGVIAASLQVTLEETAILLANAPVPVNVAGDDADQDVREPEANAERARQDPLVARGAEYARLSWPILKTLRPILARHDDRQARDAAERLEETFATVASKIFRAVSSSLSIDHDPSDMQSDANGSAKVALLLIEESRQAWRVLTQPGRAVGNGAPVKLIALLEGLELELLTRFPHALAFVRPGFDTGQADSRDHQLSRALLLAGRTIGRA